MKCMIYPLSVAHILSLLYILMATMFKLQQCVNIVSFPSFPHMELLTLSK